MRETASKSALLLRAHAPASCHRRQQRQRDHEAGRQRKGDRERQGAEQLPSDSLYIDDWTKNADGRECGGSDCTLNLFGTATCGIDRSRTQLPVSKHILEHHNGVVYQHSHAERESAKTHDVERHAGQIQQCEAGHHRDWNRQGDSDGIPYIAHEQEENQEREDTTEDQSLNHVRDGIGYEPRLAHRYVESYFRVLDAELLNDLLNAFGHTHGVGA